MAKVHISRQGFIGKSTLPNVSRPGPDVSYNLIGLLNANQTIDNVSNTEVIDSSSFGRTVCYQAGFPSQVQFSPFSAGVGGSMYFDGAGDYLQFATSNDFAFGTGDFTIEFWVYLTSGVNTVTGLNIYEPRTTTNQIAPLLYVNTSSGNSIRFFVNGADRINGGTVTTNAWNHIALSRVSGITTLYLNGTATGSPYTDTNNYITNTNRPLIGGNGDQAGQPNNFNSFRTNGQQPFLLSNLRVVKGIGVYTGNFTVPTSPLTATQSAGTNIAAISGTETVLLLNFTNFRVVDSSTNNVKGLAPSSLSYGPTGGQTRFSPYSGGGTYGSYWFDGSFSFIDSPANADFGLGSGDFTIEAWVYRQNNNAHVICSSWNSGVNANCGFIFSINASNFLSFTYMVGTTQTNFTGNANVLANQWNHVAVVRSGSNIRFYNNGTLASTVGTISGALNTPATAPLRIGGYQETSTVTNGTLGFGAQFSSAPMSGYITGLRIVKGTAVYTGTFTPPSIQSVDVSGAASAASYPSTTNIDTTFASTQTMLLCKFERATLIDNDALPRPVYLVGTQQTSTTQAKFGAASMFSGSSLLNTSCCYIAAPYTFTGNFTLQCWLYTSAWNSPNNQNGVFYIGLPNSTTSSSNSYFLYFSNSGTLTFDRYGGAATNLGTINTATFTNTWFHLALVRNGTTVTAYINGTSIGSTTNYSGLTVGNASGIIAGGRYTSGAIGTSSYTTWNGYVDDVVITPNALWTSNFTPPTTQATDPYIAPSTTTNNIYGLIQNY